MNVKFANVTLAGKSRIIVDELFIRPTETTWA